MRILGLDTATSATTVALIDAPGELACELRDDPPPGARPAHATRLMPMIAEILEHTGTSWADIDRIAVGTGPGTFTGLRIGLATARALALAREIPLVGVSTLASLALNAATATAPGATVLAVLDARRGEVFAAAWTGTAAAAPAAGAEPLLAPEPLRPEALARRLRDLGSPILAVGDGAVKFRDVLELWGASIPDDDSALHRVSAVSHCRLAADLPAVDPDQVRPDYLRVPDAEITRRAQRTP